MNAQQKRIYDDLFALTKAESGTFIFFDNTINETVYRIFSYRLIPSYTMWLINDSALECRGITFEMDDEDHPVRLVSWPLEKFFNLQENPMTMDLDLSRPTEILSKEDGSLISSMYLKDKDDLHLKSKASLYSEQAKAANELIRQPDWRALYEWTLDWAKRGHTVILEYISPFNQIVVPYEATKLVILAVRNNANGSYVNIFNMDLPFEIQQHVVVNLANDIEDPLTFIQNIPTTKGLEGYVVCLASGQRVKVKTEWYKALHNKKSRYADLSVAGLAKAILQENIDDLRSMYAFSPEILKKIDSATMKVANIYNETVKATTDFYNNNRDLSRREFAVLAKKELTSNQFGLAMKMFAGKPVDFAESVLCHLKRDKITF